MFDFLPPKQSKAGRTPASWGERFWPKVRKTNRCWKWIGAKRGNYGCFRVGSHVDGTARNMMAHRAAWMFYHGTIPRGMQVLHHCDNPLCVNPGHLFLGNHSDNMKDMHSKGRGRKQDGEKNCVSKLKEADVIEIRKLKKEGRLYHGMIGKLAKQYGVHRNTLTKAINGETWKQAAR